MEANDLCRSLARHLTRNPGTPITALNPVAGVAQTIHQDVERFGHPRRVPTPTGRWPGKSEARKRRNNDVKGRSTAVLRIRERLHQRKKFHGRTPPFTHTHYSAW